jgi:hypothetical protein
MIFKDSTLAKSYGWLDLTTIQALILSSNLKKWDERHITILNISKETVQ